MIVCSAICDANKAAHFLTADLKDHFLQRKLPNPKNIKYTRKYNTNEIVAEDGHVDLRIKKECSGPK